MKFIRFALLATASAAVAFGQLPTQKLLTVDVAQNIAQEAIMKCRAEGFKVSVWVVDGTNTLKAFLRDDGAIMASVEVAKMKANTVMGFNRPSGPPANLAPGAPVPPPTLPGTTNSLGGVPIKVGDQLIGAVGVSGAIGAAEKDAACASAALVKLADKLR